MLWEIDILPAPGQPDRAGSRVAAAAAELGWGGLAVSAAHGFLLEGALDAASAQRLARSLLADSIVEQTRVAEVGDARLLAPPAEAAADALVVHVLPKPGVTDPVAESALRAIADFQLPVDAVRTFRKYWLGGLPAERVERLALKVLANASIEQVVVGPLRLDHLHLGGVAEWRRVEVPLRELDDDQLAQLSRDGQLHLTLPEMRTIQAHFRELGREPTDIELETVAQTWSEHCSHKTLAGRIAYRDERGARQFSNMLKETIFAATLRLREEFGADDWCVSVFRDNAGIVRFDERHNIAFKVETHNHPSAIEPYGGANTGLGGVIRDTLGTGLGAKPVCSTDVFCFAAPDTLDSELPPGVLHPRRVMQGVVSGVRDYGNRMGIPTVNGAICFDDRYLGNPLVFCGNVGLIPCEHSFKQPRAGDWIVSIGGRTGRDGIHGATFSSAPMSTETESVSGGAVQIGNAITEKMVQDVLLEARDRGLYNAVTDCGAGGFSSAVGEMGEEIGAEVYLERAPLKYSGLSYTEIWISEAQERMVLSVPPEHWEEFESLCRSEGVEATIIGKFVPTGRLSLTFEGHPVGELSMEFLHGGRPPVVREAVYEPPAPRALSRLGAAGSRLDQQLLAILGALNVCSKEWVIRQYDHEVQGGSVLKPLVGVANDGPGDAAVVRPVLDSRRGLVVSCGINPHYGDHDPARMAASAIDEALRNCVAVGADPDRVAVLDNFCWGYTDRPETLGSLVRAALACHDVSLALRTPFISGKDSLNNEFRYESAEGPRNIAIPPTLLISALGQVDDVSQCVSMDLKRAGDLLYVVGETRDELGGSHWTVVEGLEGGVAPSLDADSARRIYRAVHAAIRAGVIRACHDCSEGGLATALAEMCLAGGLGASVGVAELPRGADETVAENAGSSDATVGSDPRDGAPHEDIVRLFAESNSRLVCEVAPEDVERFEALLADVPHKAIGVVEAATGDESPRLQVLGLGGAARIDVSVAALREAWQAPLRW